ncbi:hypothetical protein SAMN05192549_12063 [Duganella sacchari]|uniref:Uncharacterized protein n=1 Tax=Duganella sacchari TaxID=551987 RepID=A0A1M7RCY6_9BURK|nr:hypothetical protein [Duganella sacchari]SHN44167.1 hypothetical protein SAMN05192549_12063 [Duganella sacchari]
MKLTHAPGYSIRVITPPTSEVAPTSELIIEGKPTGRILGGAVFEAALNWNDYVLLFLTDDVPFEDTLNIYVLDENLEVVDSARMFYIYSTGVFSALDLTEPDTVRFRFFGGTLWTLKLFPEKRFALPIVSGTLGVSRPFTFFRLFQLHSRPLPEPSQSENYDYTGISS